MASPIAIPIAPRAAPKAIPVAHLPHAYVDDIPVARPIADPAMPSGHFPVRVESKPVRNRLQQSHARKDWMVWTGGLMLLVACLGMLSWFGLWLATRTQPQAVVTVELSPAFRHESALLIDGERQELPVAGPVELRLLPGTHQLTLRRRGFEPVSTTLQLARRQKMQFSPQWKKVQVDADQLPAPPDGVSPAAALDPNGTPPQDPAPDPARDA